MLRPPEITADKIQVSRSFFARRRNFFQSLWNAYRTGDGSDGQVVFSAKKASQEGLRVP